MKIEVFPNGYHPKPWKQKDGCIYDSRKNRIAEIPQLPFHAAQQLCMAVNSHNRLIELVHDLANDGRSNICLHIKGGMMCAELYGSRECENVAVRCPIKDAIEVLCGNR